MPLKGKHSRRSRRRNPSLKPDPKHSIRHATRSGNTEEEILNLVREGVEKFILKNATVDDFLRTIRAMTEKGNVYSHPLTSPALLKIIKEVTRKRNVKRSK